MKQDTKRIQHATPELQVMICTYGQEGLKRTAASSHPRMEGVEYIVCIQQDPADEGNVIPQEMEREDFRLYFHNSKGLSINRNTALSRASAPLLLISDDDVDYTKEGLRAVMDAFHNNPEAGLITFKFESDSSRKTYPSSGYDISRLGKLHCISSIEIALRRESIEGKVWFNENFGIGATFPSGEEDVFLQDCLNHGIKCLYVPSVIARHDGTTTSARNLMLPSRPKTKGALFLHLHPHDWILRMIAHTIREIPMWIKGQVPSPLSYCLNWLKGAKTARRMDVFPTPDYSSHYPCHD